MLRSLRARLLIGGMLWIMLGVGLAGVFISALFRTHVTELVNSELIGHLDELERLLVRTPDGGIALSRRLSDPRFAQHGTGFYWQVNGPGGALLRSPSLAPDEHLPSPRVRVQPVPLRIVEHGPAGPMIAFERAWAGDTDRRYIMQVCADQRIVDEVLAHFDRALFASLGLLSLTLAAAGALQIWFGLRPMRRLRVALSDIRSGKATALPRIFPSEVQPLVDDLNALLDANMQMVRRARTQAGNLAHGLKTPLAVLADESRRLLARGDMEGAAVLAQQSERMQRQIDFHLARTRAAANAGLPGVLTPMEPAIQAIVTAMRRLYADRALAITLDVAPGLAAAIDSRDLDEMLGNLIDNACKWATESIRIAARRDEDQGQLLVTILDDGPGIPEAALSRVFMPGERLDEAKPGSGLGLSIVHDLATLYGGRVVLRSIIPQGLSAELRLPAL